MSIRVRMEPQPGKWPDRGGVREHLRQLYHYLDSHPQVELVANRPDIVHLESSFSFSKSPDVYVCHGGFVPNPMHSVVMNLATAKVVVSVARWLVQQYFPHLLHKTVVISNGVNLDEWNDLPPSGLEPGYVLYAKEWSYHIDDLVSLAWAMPDERFVSTAEPKGMSIPSNLEVIGIQDRNSIRSVINDAKCLLLTGREVCPTMLLEAWACRVPIVCRVGGGCSELMFDRECGTYVGGYLYSNLDECAESIRTLDEFDRSAIGDIGRKRVEHRYQWCHLADRYVDLYEAIIQNEAADYVAAWHVCNREQAAT